MDIILLESLNKLGKAGEIVTVKDGFAKNFLIPEKKAIIANKKNKADL
jgi:large subunit ribosomal protein L9